MKHFCLLIIIIILLILLEDNSKIGLFFSLILFFFVAVFVPGYDVITSYTSLLGLHQCDQRFRDHVTVHLVYPLSHPPAENTLGHYLEQALRHYRNCDEFLTSLKSNELGKHSLNYANDKV